MAPAYTPSLYKRAVGHGRMAAGTRTAMILWLVLFACVMLVLYLVYHRKRDRSSSSTLSAPDTTQESRTRANQIQTAGPYSQDFPTSNQRQPNYGNQVTDRAHSSISMDSSCESQGPADDSEIDVEATVSKQEVDGQCSMENAVVQVSDSPTQR